MTGPDHQPDRAGPGPAADLVRMTVDEQRCIGGGQCELLAEEVFRIDEDSAIAQVIGAGTLPRDRALVVVDRCPSGACGIVEP